MLYSGVSRSATRQTSLSVVAGPPRLRIGPLSASSLNGGTARGRPRCSARHRAVTARRWPAAMKGPMRRRARLPAIAATSTRAMAPSTGDPSSCRSLSESSLGAKCRPIAPDPLGYRYLHLSTPSSCTRISAGPLRRSRPLRCDTSKRQQGQSVSTMTSSRSHSPSDGRAGAVRCHRRPLPGHADCSDQRR